MIKFEVMSSDKRCVVSWEFFVVVFWARGHHCSLLCLGRNMRLVEVWTQQKKKHVPCFKRNQHT